MDDIALQTLARYKTLIDADVAAYSETLTGRWQRDIGFETAQVLDSYLAILARGGKRLRGSLAIWAYGLGGGEDEALAVHLARCLEMIHAYLLVVDDVVDKAETRRGGPSAHILLETYHKTEGWFGDAKFFGQMQAINAGLTAQHLVMQEIAEMATVDSTKLEILRELNAMLFKTGAGQIADVNYQALRNVGEREVINMMTQKTAYYSFVSPLQLGIIMAGKDWAGYAWLEQWALNIGLGFQINDDILGIFGDEKLSGKSNLSDLREGKLTLLIVRALAHSDENEKNQLLTLLGKSDLNQVELEQAQIIIEDSGALQYCRTLAKNYTTEAVTALDKASAADKEQANMLRTLSLSLVKRQS